MIIVVHVLGQDIGSGWHNDAAVRIAMSKYTVDTWEEDLAELIAGGEDVIIDVQFAPDRVLQHPIVAADSLETVHLVQQLLTNDDLLWEGFCGSEQAANLYRGT